MTEALVLPLKGDGPRARKLLPTIQRDDRIYLDTSDLPDPLDVMKARYDDWADEREGVRPSR